MSKPNFFIVGAPKCGTTALSEYLRDHPNVFISTPKEPHFFAEDFENYRRSKTIEQYESLFDGCYDQHKAIGEASVFYLRSEKAPSLIKKYRPDAKIIVMLRNPVDLIYSFHAQLRISVDEAENDFEEAWRLQPERARGHSVPSNCREPAFLQYKEMGLLGKQLKRLLEIFPAEQIKIILFDDFAPSPRKIYLEVLDFLGIDDDNRTDFQRVNPNQKHRLDFAGKLLGTIPQGFIALVLKFKELLGIKKLNVLQRLRALNTKTVARPPLADHFTQELNNEFASDIQLIEELLKINLDHWKI